MVFFIYFSCGYNGQVMPIGEFIDEFLNLGRNKIQGDAIVAISQSRGRGSIIENMSLMPAASRAMVFRTLHEKLVIFLGLHMPGQHVEKTGPACAAIKFVYRREKLETASGADKHARALFVVERTAEGRFGPFLTQNAVLYRRQLGFPFRIRFHDFGDSFFRKVSKRSNNRQGGNQRDATRKSDKFSAVKTLGQSKKSLFDVF
jgi:hypothetical protein